MGLLDQLWDDTVAGPRPENGLGKLRKHDTFSFRSAGSGKGTQLSALSGAGGEQELRIWCCLGTIEPHNNELKFSYHYLFI